jgi:hypothetical protein
VITGILLVHDTLLSPKLLVNLGKTYHTLNIFFIKLIKTMLKLGKQLRIVKQEYY